MSLTASMWTGVSGLLAHGEKMNVIGNNIANVNTVGFKAQRMDFADFVYQNTFTTSGTGQMGRGVTPGIIMNDFSQGPYESTTSPTDLAISGRGFFQVNKIGTKEAYYTRSGNFTFNKAGYLVDPNGYAVQGWKIDNRGGVQQASGSIAPSTNTQQSTVLGTGSPQDILLDSWTVNPQQTTNVEFTFQLTSKAEDNTQNNTNPFAGLFGLWNGTYPPATPNTKPIPQNSFAYSDTIEVFDEAGVSHKLTVYLDRVNKDDYSGGGSGQIWEYIVTMDPSEDMREFAYTDPVTGQVSTKKVNETKAGGLLMSGTMEFNSGGNLINQSAYTWGGAHNVTDFPNEYTKVKDPSDPAGLRELDVVNLDPDNMNNWYPAAISNSGLPIFVPNFSGILDAQTPGTKAGSQFNTEFSLGARASNFSMPWQNQASLGSLSVPPYVANTNYNPDGSKGPEYFLVNPSYDPALNKATDAQAYNYLFKDVVKYTYNAAGELTGPNGAVVTVGGVAVTDPAVLTKALYDHINGVAGAPAVLYDGVTVNSAATAQTAMNTINAQPKWGSYSSLTAAEKIAYWQDADALLPTFPVDATTGAITVPATAYAAGTPVNANDLAGFTKPVVIESNPTVIRGDAGSSTLGRSQDGYTYGNLTSYYVDKAGILSGVYSNGVTLPLWQMVLYDFTATQGLRREGGNLFSATRASGDPKSGPSGVAGLGTIQGQSLEQSNVDMSREFVQMITTQRGFQSNSKIITTTDTMLDTVINMKR